MQIGKRAEGEGHALAFTWMDVMAFVIALVLVLAFLFGWNITG